MNKTKLANYRLTASIHTINLRSKAQPLAPEGIDSKILQPCYLPKTGVWSTIINPNKLRGDIFTYSEFCAVVNELCDMVHIPDFKYYRTDIRLDSYEDTFKDYY